MYSRSSDTKKQAPDNEADSPAVEPIKAKKASPKAKRAPRPKKAAKPANTAQIVEPAIEIARELAPVEPIDPANFNPPDDSPAQLMPVGAAEPQVMVNRELFLRELIARKTRVEAPNPVRYSDKMIAIVLVQWGVLSATASEIVVVDAPKEDVSKEFEPFMAEALALKKTDDAAMQNLIRRLAAHVARTKNPFAGSEAEKVLTAISKTMGRKIGPLRAAFKIIFTEEFKEAQREAAAAGFGGSAGGAAWGPGGVGGGAGASSGPGASGKFHMAFDGLYRRTGFTWEWISQPFEVLGLSRDNVAATESNRSWSTLIKFQDRDNRVTEHIVEHSELVVDFNDVLSRLTGCGLQMSFDISQRRSVADYLFSADVAERVTRTKTTGWIKIGAERAFVLPDEIIGKAGAERIVLDQRTDAGYAKSGTLDQWREAIAAQAGGHLMMRFAISISLSGPLLAMGPYGSRIWHVFGDSGAGKTTLQRVCASSWGSGLDNGYMRPWRTTSNAMEATLSLANDTVFVLDEVGQADPRELGAMVYMVAGSQGKSRMRADASVKPSYKWRVPVFSTGENAMAIKIGEEQKGKRAFAGQMVRAMDIPDDRKRGCGVFDGFEPGVDASVFAKGLEVASGKYHGTAGPEFVRQLIERRVTGERVRGFVAEFVDKALKDVPKRNHGQVARVAEQFGVVATAGNLAAEFGIVPWNDHQTAFDALELFKQWLAARPGGSAPIEIKQKIDQVRGFIEAYGDSRFQNLNPQETNFAGIEIPWPKPSKRAGFRKGEGEDELWYVLPGPWRDDVCAGLDPSNVAEILSERGILLRDGEGKFSRSETIEGKKQRVYVLTAAIFER